MTQEYKYCLGSKKIANDIDIDSYLPLLDYSKTASIEEWCSMNIPTAKIYRDINSDNLYLYVTWYILFENQEDLVLYQLSK